MSPCLRPLHRLRAGVGPLAQSAHYCSTSAVATTAHLHRCRTCWLPAKAVCHLCALPVFTMAAVTQAYQDTLCRCATGILTKMLLVWVEPTHLVRIRIAPVSRNCNSKAGTHLDPGLPDNYRASLWATSC